MNGRESCCPKFFDQHLLLQDGESFAVFSLSAICAVLLIKGCFFLYKKWDDMRQARAAAKPFRLYILIGQPWGITHFQGKTGNGKPVFILLKLNKP